MNARLLTPKHSLIALLVLFIAGCGGGGASYRGKPMAFWLNQLERPKEATRSEASIALGKICAPAIPALRQKLKHPNPQVRLAAANAIAKMFREGREAVPDLILLLNEDDPGIQAAAARALAHIGRGAKSAAPYLVPLLSSDDVQCRYHAADALGRMCEEAAEQAGAMSQLLQDPNLDVRRVTAFRIGNLGAEEVIPAVIAALNDEDRKVRMYAGFSLRNIDREVGAKYGYW